MATRQYLHRSGVDGLLGAGVQVAVDAGQDWLGLLLEEIHQEDGERVRRESPLSLSVQHHQTGPVLEGHPQGPDPLVQAVVVPQQAAGLRGVEVVETQLTVEVAVGGESDGRDLGGEVVSHRVEVTGRMLFYQ